MCGRAARKAKQALHLADKVAGFTNAKLAIRVFSFRPIARERIGR
jgi:hypothetical protein